MTRAKHAGIWALFCAAHGSIAWHLIALGDIGFGDVRLYHYWVSAESHPVFDHDWVYPVLALVPMVLLSAISNSDAYLWAWLALATAANAAVVGLLLHRLRRGAQAAMWWCVFIALLGPVALARLDTYVSALAILAVLALLAEPIQTRTASALLMISAWIKVAHIFWLVPLFATVRMPWRTVVLPAAMVTALVLSSAWLGGAGWRVFSFGATQNARGLQIESVLAAPFHIARLLGADFEPEYNERIATVEFPEPLAAQVAAWADLALIVGVLAIAALAWRAAKRHLLELPRVQITALLAVTLTLLVLNKVGSPQLMIWLVAPIIGCIALAGHGFSRRTTWLLAGCGLAIAGLTQIIFPHGYTEFAQGEPLQMVAYLLRCGLLLSMFGYGLALLIHAGVRERARART